MKSTSVFKVRDPDLKTKNSRFIYSIHMYFQTLDFTLQQQFACNLDNMKKRRNYGLNLVEGRQVGKVYAKC